MVQYNRNEDWLIPSLSVLHLWKYKLIHYFLGGSVVKNLPAMWQTGSIPGLERSPGEGNGNPLQDSNPENSVDRGAWRAIVHSVTESWTFSRLP